MSVCVVTFVHNSPVNLTRLFCVCVDAEVMLQSCCYAIIQHTS